MPWAGPRISVCILNNGRAEQFGRFLSSLENQIDPPTYELILGVVEGSPIRELFDSSYPTSVINIDRASRPGEARNLLLEKSRGELLFFVDDDVVLARDTLRQIDRLVEDRPDVQVFGGPNLTPDGSSNFQLVQGAVLGTLTVTGPIRRRYGNHPPARADDRSLMLCNLVIRKDVMKPFSHALVCAEENDVLHQLEVEGIKMRYEPSFSVFHERRPDLRTFAAQMHKYGVGRGQLIRERPRTLHSAYLVPSVLIAYLIVSPLLISASRLWALPLVAYLATVSLGALKIAASFAKTRVFITAGLLTLVVHGCYGIGLVRGLVLGHSKPTKPTRWSDVREPIAQPVESLRR